MKNAPGKPDLVTANNAGTVSVLIGDGDGTFHPAQNYYAGLSPCSVAIADLNGDGRPDLIVGDRVGDTVNVLLNISGEPVVTLVSSLDPSTVGSIVTFTAIVPPSLGKVGAVQFKSDNDILGTMPLISGSASLSTAALTRGSHTITATYVGSKSPRG